MAETDEQQKAVEEAAAAEAAKAKEAEEAKAAERAKEESEFDKDRALETIRKQRESETAAIKRAKELEAKVKEFEDRDKSKEEKAAEAASTASKEAAEAKTEAARLRAAIKFGLDEEDLDLLGTGDADQIEARAKRLAERFGGKGDDTSRRRPKERLKSGATADEEPDESDPRKLAEKVPRY